MDGYSDKDIERLHQEKETTQRAGKAIEALLHPIKQNLHDNG